MKFDRYIPADALKPYIKYYVVSENAHEAQYKVFPVPGPVIGFQYKGQLDEVKGGAKNRLATAGITGMTDGYKVFGSSAAVGTVLVYFTEVGLAQFTSRPTHELFNQSVALEHVFDRYAVEQVETRLASTVTDIGRIQAVEKFLLTRLRTIRADQLVAEAVRQIYQSAGSIRIAQLAQNLCISQGPLEKRFRAVVGTTPKKFATVVRFNTVLAAMGHGKTLTEICYEHHFFDQAHFIKDFRQFTGDTPENFNRLP